MKVPGAPLLLAAALLSVCAKSAAAREEETPIARVASLLQGLALKVEHEGKEEEQLYKRFVCWAKGVLDAKAASNAAATSRISTLEAYVADIDAGRVEFTTERADLEGELSALLKDTKAATSLRTRERDEFLSAEAEMKAGIQALDQAILVLQEASGGAPPPVLAQRQGRLRGQRRVAGAALEAALEASGRSEASVSSARALARAAELAGRRLSAGDAVFLRRLLTGEVPSWNWNKLARKPIFKTSYKARSSRIQQALVQLRRTLAESLEGARAKEVDAKGFFGKLTKAKGLQQSQTESALRKMEAESGARGLSRDEATAELEALRLQVANDEKYIKQTKQTMEERAEEWKDRQAMRLAEVAAMGRAVEILRSGESRDQVMRSFASQGYLLLQERASEGRSAKRRGTAAVGLLLGAARRASDSRLRTLAAHLVALGSGSSSHFDDVIRGIDVLLHDLGEEEGEDLVSKEHCEKERAADTRNAASQSRSIDEASEAIAKFREEAEELGKEVAESQEAKRQTQKQLRVAAKNRNAERSEWLASELDDKSVAAMVKKAKEVLAKFYSDNNLVLAQQPKVDAGKAPPPPPATWDAPYLGKSEQSMGVIAVLETILEDISKDIKLAKAAEEKAQSEFTTFDTESRDHIKVLDSAIIKLMAAKGEKEKSASDLVTARAGTKAELDATMKMISDANPGCNFITLNYQARLVNRRVEIDGLLKAKAILEGAAFGR